MQFYETCKRTHGSSHFLQQQHKIPHARVWRNFIFGLALARVCRFPATKNLQGTKPEVLSDGTDNSVRNSKFFEYPRLFIYISIIILLRIRGYFIKHS